MEFDKEDVKAHLKELGYSRIEDDTLELFIKDLRKLIFLDELRGRSNAAFKKLSNFSLEHDLTDSVSSNNKQSIEDSRILCCRTKQHDNNLANIKVSRQNVLMKSSYSYSSSCLSENMHSFSKENFHSYSCSTSLEPSTSGLQDDVLNETNSNSEVLIQMRFGNHGDVDPLIATNTRPVKTIFTKPTRSFIRSARTKYVAGRQNANTANFRCDPVRLHDNYERIWKRTKFPGDNHDKQLRWTVREFMLGNAP